MAGVYNTLSRTQKLATFLIVIGPEAAAHLLKEFEDDEIELICREMTGIMAIEEDDQKQAIEEFSGVVLSSYSSLLGGSRYTRKALEIAKGDFKATSILERIAPSSNSAEVIKEIEQMEPQQIFNMIKTEQSQTIAFVLSYLENDKAGLILGMFSQELREEVIERLGMLEPTSLEIINKVAGSLSKNLDIGGKVTMNRSGGVSMVADLLNTLEKDDSKSILANIEERNSALGSEIRKKMFSFGDLIRLELPDLQRIMREVDSGDLTLALKLASETLRDFVMQAVSKRAAETLLEELEMMGPVKLTIVEAAQERVIQVVRRLEEQEEISLDGGSQTV
ncbi:MAG: flagellar motor switch protein FliG [Opitutales bacterium]|jgi:flagellar motor switch protein FliG|nr:flagellar motor switch protein FliG [Opitutales bacterium]MBT6581653.1 flagellar motor switch protein FliG [Bacteroidetes Order II. bacterium]MDG2253974.1 flagellar motor switch protein FliG [Opitutaceae bacterium]MBT5168851.1 flagellar motor switch protein FliG [Opitutales bacterium]MBT5813624.1 flagellar motor switch protein FliG [Opitutales bacterium]